MHSRLLEINKQLEVLDDACVLIETQRTWLKLQHALAHNASQPLLCLPDEIISQILQYDLPHPGSAWLCHPSSSLLTPTPGYNQQLLTMNAVCTKLRFVALHSPRCWTSVVIRTLDAELPVPSTMLASFLERSKGCQFDLHLRLNSIFTSHLRYTTSSGSSTHMSTDVVAWSQPYSTIFRTMITSPTTALRSP